MARASVAPKKEDIEKINERFLDTISNPGSRSVLDLYSEDSVLEQGDTTKMVASFTWIIDSKFP